MEPASHPKKTRFKFIPPKTAKGHQKVLTIDSDIAIYCGCPTDSFWPEHIHGYVQIMLTYSPKGGELVWKDPEGNKNREILRDGYVYFIGSAVPHSLTWTQGYLIIFYLAPHYASELEKVLSEGVCVQSFTRMLGHDYVVCALVDLFRHWCTNRPDHDYPLIIAAARAVIRDLAHACVSDRIRERGRLDQLSIQQFAAVTGYMEKHLHENIRVKDLARLVFRSPKHFMRLFKNTAATPAISYFRRMKTTRAKELLASGDFTIAEVVNELGFYDQSLLNRYFRKYLKTTPRKVLLSKNVPKMAASIQDTG